MKLLRYKVGSRSAKALRDNLRPRRVLYKLPTTPVRNRRETIVNWGNTRPLFNTTGLNIINKPEAIKLSSNKLQALLKMKEAGVVVPTFTTSKEEALGWLRDGGKVVQRTLLGAHSGKGIVVARTEAELIHAPLYTRYFKKEHEFRVHVFMGKVIDYTMKKARLNKDSSFDPLIRSNLRGWVYCRENVQHIDLVKQEAQKAVTALGLDFGAVDVMWNGKKACVLEVNTAPGLCETTAKKYAQAITEARFL